MKKIVVIVFLCAMVVGTVFAGGRGQADPARFPTRPVTATVAWPAGTAADMVFRAIAEVFPNYANGQPFVVDNRPCAAGGVQGVVDFMLHARPDGYHVFQWMIAHVIRSHWDNLPFTGTTFEPVAKFMESYNYICVDANSRFQTLQELISYARANPGQVTVGNAGPGGGNHMAAIMLERAAGVQFRHVSYPGGPMSINAVMAGEIDASMNIAPEGISNAHGGLIRILGTLSPRRFAEFPHVPTAREAGVDVIMAQWRGIVVPRGTPPEIVQRLEDIMRQVVANPTFVERMESMNAYASFLNARDFNALIESEDRRIEAAIREAGIGNVHGR